MQEKVYAVRLRLIQRLGGRDPIIRVVSANDVLCAIEAVKTPVCLPKRLFIVGESPIYRAMYEKRYADKVKGKHKSSALKGSLLESVTAVGAIVLVLVSSRSY